MICPQCGYDIGTKHKCLRCGYEVEALVVVDEKEKSREEKKKTDEPEVIDIDPTNVYLTHPYGYEDDAGTGFGPFGNPFASLFDDLFGDPITDLLGGLFGFGAPRRRTVVNEEPPKKKRKQGPVIDVAADEVEIVEEKPQKQEKPDKKPEDKKPADDPKQSRDHRSKFKRKKK